MGPNEVGGLREKKGWGTRGLEEPSVLEGKAVTQVDIGSI